MIQLNKHLYTILGLISIFFWSTTIGVQRALIEELGFFTAISSFYAVTAILSFGYIMLNKSYRENIRRVNRRYIYVCGSLMILYVIAISLSIALVSSRQQVIEIGLINYLWPSLTIVFSLFLFGYKAKPRLAIGLILATVGIYIATSSDAGLSFATTLENIQNNWLAYAVALSGAIMWGLYSNLSRLWGSDSKIDGMPIFIIAASIVLLIARLFVTETSNWSIESILGILYMAIFPTFLGYLFWDKAMRKGDIILVASFSFFTPVLATLFSCLFLDLLCGWILWLATGLVLAGSVLSKYSILENQTATPKNARE